MKVQVLVEGLLGEGLVAILREAGMEVVGEGADVAVVDEVDSLKRAGERRLVLTDAVTGLVAAMKAGIVGGGIPHHASGTELVYAVRAVGQGALYVHPSLTAGMIDSVGGNGKSEQLEPLTPREMDVLRLIVAGYKNREAAEILRVSIRTVESHRANLMGKLGTKNRWELVKWAREKGLVSSGSG